MKTSCIRRGQIEVGIIEHQGHEHVALGATTIGRHITAYTRLINGDIQLTNWCGTTKLASRCEVVERYWSGAMSLLFRLPKNRFIVGFALGDDGMLFRGEMILSCDDGEARRHAVMVADCFAQLDAEDEDAFAAEQFDMQTPA